ncbi:MAG: NAD(P)H-dependent oxidoreductase [Erysipelotrichaceae bacterium]|nr:NAD(P)H-dependent oxidoreductase [Erysipelotrichaceae bacterium]
MKILFINGSPNKNGNTVELAKELLKNQNYETLHLVDYKIYTYGQHFDDDQFDEVVDKMSEADIIIIGAPMYWHSMCGAIRNLLDRFYGSVDETLLSNKDLYFIYQGASPTDEQLKAGNFTMSRFASLYGLNYKGMITNMKEAKELSL